MFFQQETNYFGMSFQIKSEQYQEMQITNCFACSRCFESTRDINVYRCPDCKNHFCCDCDIFIHETLHSCPGCSSTPQLASAGDPSTATSRSSSSAGTNGTSHHFNGILWKSKSYILYCISVIDINESIRIGLIIHSWNFDFILHTIPFALHKSHIN